MVTVATSPSRVLVTVTAHSTSGTAIVDVHYRGRDSRRPRSREVDHAASAAMGEDRSLSSGRGRA